MLRSRKREIASWLVLGAFTASMASCPDYQPGNTGTTSVTSTGGGGSAGGSGTASSGTGGSTGSGGAGGMDSGVQECLSKDWALWPMPNPPGTGLPNAAVYEVDGVVVIDKVTGLIWQRDVNPGAQTWDEATQLCDGLNAVKLGNRTGWRLPTRIELYSLIDFTKSTPDIDTVAFPNTPGVVFWTATPHVTNLTVAHNVNFCCPTASISPRTYLLRVRCVSDLNPCVTAPGGHYLAIDSNTVRDNLTQLTWKRMPSSAMPWSSAMTECTNAGVGFRLPSIKELETIVDIKTSAAIPLDSGAFPMYPPGAGGLWSSSYLIQGCQPGPAPACIPGSPLQNGAAWNMSLTMGGHVGIDDVAGNYVALCVK